MKSAIKGILKGNYLESPSRITRQTLDVDNAIIEGKCIKTGKNDDDSHAGNTGGGGRKLIEYARRNKDLSSS